VPTSVVLRSACTCGTSFEANRFVLLFARALPTSAPDGAARGWTALRACAGRSNRLLRVCSPPASPLERGRCGTSTALVDPLAGVTQPHGMLRTSSSSTPFLAYMATVFCAGNSRESLATLSACDGICRWGPLLRLARGRVPRQRLGHQRLIGYGVVCRDEPPVPRHERAVTRAAAMATATRCPLGARLLTRNRRHPLQRHAGGVGPQTRLRPKCRGRRPRVVERRQREGGVVIADCPNPHARLAGAPAEASGHGGATLSAAPAMAHTRSSRRETGNRPRPPRGTSPPAKGMTGQAAVGH